MRYGPEHRAQTRGRVLREAIRAIRLEGPHKVGVVEVMTRAGLTHGGFYAHFASRDDLVLAAVQEMFSGPSGIFDGQTRGLAPRRALEAFVNYYLSTTHRDGRETGCPLPILSSDLPHMPETVRAHFAKGVAWLTSGIAGLLTELGRAHADILASSILSEMIGALSLARAVPDRAQSDAILASSRAAILERLQLNNSSKPTPEPGVAVGRTAAGLRKSAKDSARRKPCGD